MPIKIIIANKDDKIKSPISQVKLANQKIPGWTPVIIWTCLAFVIRSMRGNIKNTDTSREMAIDKQIQYRNPSPPPVKPLFLWIL